MILFHKQLPSSTESASAQSLFFQLNHLIQLPLSKTLGRITTLKPDLNTARSASAPDFRTIALKNNNHTPAKCTTNGLLDCSTWQH